MEQSRQQYDRPTQYARGMRCWMGDIWEPAQYVSYETYESRDTVKPVDTSNKTGSGVKSR